MSGYQVLPVEGLPEISAGDDLAVMIHERAPWLADGDIVVVTSKVISKADGLVRAADDRERAIDDECMREVARRGPTRIVVTRHGLVMAAGGVDASNVEVGQVVTLPHDPDASARALRRPLSAALPAGSRVAVVVTDSMGRPWREGVIDVAIGVAGLVALDDYRGRTDSYGNQLAMTVTAIADEVAAAAELVKGKLGRVPVAVVRGLAHLVDDADGPGARVLVRPIEQDMFVLGAAEAALLGARALQDWLRPQGIAVPDTKIAEIADAALVEYVRSVPHLPTHQASPGPGNRPGPSRTAPGPAPPAPDRSK